MWPVGREDLEAPYSNLLRELLKTPPKAFTLNSIFSIVFLVQRLCFLVRFRVWGWGHTLAGRGQLDGERLEKLPDRIYPGS